MPIYDFRCEKCGQKFTVLVGISERGKVTCPKCQSSDVRQLITGCAIRVKDGGCGGWQTGFGSVGG